MGEEVPDWSWKWGAKVRNPIDMPDDMLKSAIDISIKELEAMKTKIDATKTGVDPLEVMGMEVAQNVKVALDSLWTPHWHVTIGRNFGSFVTHEMRMFVYFYYDGIVRGVSLPWHHAVKDREYLRVASVCERDVGVCVCVRVYQRKETFHLIVECADGFWFSVA